GLNSVPWVETPTPDSGYSSGVTSRSSRSSWTSPGTFGRRSPKLRASTPLRQTSATGAKAQGAGSKEKYVCPVPACHRAFVRKGYYQNHLRSKHALLYTVSGEMSSSSTPSTKTASETQQPPPLENGAPERPEFAESVPAQVLQEKLNLDDSMDDLETKPKTEVVSEWLKKVQDNDESAAPLLKSDGAYIESQQ